MNVAARRPSAFAARPVLVVDDSKAQRKILQMQLTRWGYQVTEAASGDEALALCLAQDFDIVLSDWMMPGMNGLEFCKAFRALPRDGYGYFILLTSKSEKAEIADGLDNGADDFLTKPVSSDELRARLRAGERILGMQDELVEKNRLIGSTLQKLQELYDSLDRDLIEARKLQQTLVRDRLRDFGAGKAALMLRPSGHVGGDLVGSFVINAHRIVVYSVDVSGHGVASAMMTARLAGLLSGASPEQNIALKTAPDGARDAWPPAIVAGRLNRMMLEELQVDQYFTLCYAEIDLETGLATFVQAGHPHPLMLRADGAIERLGDGGLPIGLIEGADYPQTSIRLRPGDRLFLVSDGVTECPNAQGEELGSDGLIRILRNNSVLDSQNLLEALLWDLNTFSGGGVFPDDVSGLIFDYLGPTPDSS
ncbi:MAG: fused response regulator/phosphatase [Pseudorhodobacter sp. PARRP1]|nr:MAG: fused response regulator/phosphatase [Pseudorhodobacter sp. PARRP1]